jgi:hypothetical protein
VTGCLGDPTALAGTQTEYPLLLAGGILYFIHFDYPSMSNTLYACPVGGCASPQVLVQYAGPANLFFVENGLIYLAGYKSVMTCPVTGCATLTPVCTLPEFAEFAGPGPAPGSFLAAGRMGIYACPTATLLASAAQVAGFGVDGTSAYWVDPPGLFKCGLAGCSQTPTSLAASVDSAALVSDGTSVFLAASAVGLISSCALQGGHGCGTLSIMAYAQKYPTGLYVTSDALYWSDLGTNGKDGNIMRLAR